MTICFLTVMPSPYMQDFFRALDADDELTIRVLYQEMSAPDTHWESESLPGYAQVLPGKWYPFWGGRLHRNPNVIAELARADAGLYVVQGYAGITSQAAMRWLNRERRAWVFWGEVPGMRKRGWLATKLRDHALQPIRRGPVGIAAIGSRAVEAYRTLTENRIPVANIPYHCDLAPFQGAAAHRSPSTSRRTILYCGQLIERKGLTTLLAAFRGVLEHCPDWQLRLVGTGPLGETLAGMLTDAERSRISFDGFQPVEALPAIFAQADLFVLPSLHDGWGVVLSQALGAGLPLVCSDAVGAKDLIEPGVNGEIFPVGDAAALTTILCRLAGDESLRHRYADESRARSDDWTLASGVRRWKQFLEEVCPSAMGRTASSAARNPA